MPILTRSGRVAIAEAVKSRPMHLAWGIGNGSWTTTFPAEDSDATALISEVGRRQVTETAYVVPDPAGDIVLPTGKFKRSLTPTNSLYVSTQFDFLDAQGSEIREIGIFIGCTTNPALPPGQQYFAPGDVVNPGILLHLEHFAPIYRSPAIRELFEVVIVF